jgi:hypothetical protein
LSQIVCSQAGLATLGEAVNLSKAVAREVVVTDVGRKDVGRKDVGGNDVGRSGVERSCVSEVKSMTVLRNSL